jgi:menaquinone-dependent protoporphyrinogen oxidase
MEKRGVRVMARVMVLHETKWGQTFKIAMRVAERLRAAGHAVEVLGLRHAPSHGRLTGLDGVVVGSCVRSGRHPRAVRRLARDEREFLSRIPSAFFSVSLLQLSTRDASRRTAEAYVPRFLGDTGWTPRLTATFAGALPLSRLGWLRRQLTRRAYRREGFSVEGDSEYTRWDEVDRFADAFAALLEPPAVARVP